MPLRPPRVLYMGGAPRSPPRGAAVEQLEAGGRLPQSPRRRAARELQVGARRPGCHTLPVLARILAPRLAADGAAGGRCWLPFVDAGGTFRGRLRDDDVVGLREAVGGGLREVRVDAAAAPRWLAELGELLGLEVRGGGVLAIVADQVVLLTLHLTPVRASPGGRPAGIAAVDAVRMGPGRRQRRRMRNQQFAYAPGPEVRAPAPVAAVADDDNDDELPPTPVRAMVSRLADLDEGRQRRYDVVQRHLRAVEEIERRARTGAYDADVPVRVAVAELEEAVLDTIDSFNIIGGIATQLREDIAAAGYTPTTPPRQLSENPPEELLTPSLRRRLLRRQAKKN
ncbi:hypothetical protein ACP70R_004204 [Stipagrostis hirtigluma subsp. patula]